MVITVIPDLVRGGGELVARQIHEGLISRGREALLVYACGGGATPFCSKSLHGKHARDVMAWRHLGTLLKENANAIVHCHMFPSQLAVSILAPRGTTIITTEHSTYNRRRDKLFGKVFDRWMYKRFSAIVCISEAVRASLQTWVPETSPRSHVVRNGIDLKRFSVDAKMQPRGRLVSVGRLESVKGFDIAIRAVASLVDRFPEIRYDIYGSGPLELELQRLINQLGVEKTVCLKGRTDNVSGMLRNYALKVMPSRWEGFGLAAVEAMASGLPVVASDVPGLGDIIAEGTGIKCRSESADALAKAIAHFLMLSDDTVLSMGARARRHAEQFSFETTLEQYIRIYESFERLQ